MHARSSEGEEQGPATLMEVGLLTFSMEDSLGALVDPFSGAFTLAI